MTAAIIDADVLDWLTWVLQTIQIGEVWSSSTE